MLPPCKNVLDLKVKRINQICAVWNYATQKEPRFYMPIENGWSLQDNKFVKTFSAIYFLNYIT